MKPDKYKNMGVKVIKTEQSGTPKSPEKILMGNGKTLIRAEFNIPAYQYKTHKLYNDLIQLISETPNDMELGKMVRRLIGRYDKDKCQYCGKDEPCKGSYPEGCFHKNA